MQFCDLKKQFNTYEEEIMQAIRSVIDTSSFINGHAVDELEDALLTFAGVKHVIACSSGTSALLMPLMAMDIDPGDEIICPAFTYIATASMISLYRAKPIFVDVDYRTCNIDVSLIERAITPKTKGIIAVSLFGQCADFDAINDIAKKYGLWVIEDGAQSLGATYKNRQSCSMTTVATTSFFPAKPLGGYGDGGAMFTNDDTLGEKLRIIKGHGQTKRYEHKYIGLNGRIDTLQAAIVNVKLKHFAEELTMRQSVAENYTKRLKGLVELPYIEPHNTSTWAQYTVKLDNRDNVREQLSQCGVPTVVHYPIPLHRQEAFAYLGYEKEAFPVANKLSKEVLSLPMHPFLTEDEIEEVVTNIKKSI